MVLELIIKSKLLELIMLKLIYDGAMKTLCDVRHMPRLKRKKVCETENLTILRTSAFCDLFHTPLAASSSCLVSISLF
jgi:hypothetical protein